MNLIKNSNYFNAMLLQFITSVIVIISYVYVNLLFLSTYTKNLLPYFFIAQSGATFIIVILIAPLLSKGNKFNEFILLLVLAVLVILGIYSLQLKTHWIPFIFCIILSFIAVLVGAVSTSITNSLFNIRDFKKKAKWINLAGDFGAIFSGLGTTVIIKQLGSGVLLYLLSTLILFSSMYVFFFETKTSLSKNEKEIKKSASNYPLYQSYIMYLVVLLIAYTFTDYSFKAKLSATLDKNEIGIFTGYVFAACYVVDTCFQLFFLDKFLKKYGTVKLFLVMPIYWIISAVFVIFYPSLYTIAFLAAGWGALHSSTSIGRNLILNILPTIVAKQANFKIKGIITPASTGIAAIMMLPIINYFGYTFISCLVIVLCGFLIFWTPRIFRSYEFTLRSSIQLKKFNTSLIESDKTQQGLLQQIAIKLLYEKDPNQIRFGIHLLNSLKLATLPPKVLELLGDKLSDIRISVAQLIKRFRYKEGATKIVQQLEIEQDPTVISELLDTLSVLEPKNSKKMVEKYLVNPKRMLRIGAIKSTLRLGIKDNLQSIFNSLKEMIQDQDPKIRYLAIAIISDYRINEFKDDLVRLISDAEPDVSNRAISAVTSQKNTEAIPALIKNLEKRKKFFPTMKALVSFNSEAIFELQQYVLNSKSMKGKLAAIRVISLISHPNAEEAFLEILKTKDFLVCFAIAKQSAYRALRQTLSNQYKKNIRKFITGELFLIRVLKQLYKEELTQFKKFEINSRIFLLKKRCLYWLAAFTSTDTILRTMHSILDMKEDHTVMQAKAVELLDVHLKDRYLANEFSLAFDVDIKKVAIDQKNLIYTFDPWLAKILEYNESQIAGKAMHITEKILLLRSVKLFHHLAGETLVLIANECITKEMVEGEVIFSEGDMPTGLYMIASGSVDIIRHNKIIAELAENDFFGELGLLDDAPRVATAKAKIDGVLLFLSKETFEDIINDLPEIFKSVVQTVLGYLRKDIEETKNMS